MTAATSQGKEYALKALQSRREGNRDEDWSIRTSSLPAGSPMYFGCLGCNAAIVVPENYLSRPNLCVECAALKEMGWLE